MSAYNGIVMTGLGRSAPQYIKLEHAPYWASAPQYAIGLICTVSPGATLTYSVQVTADQFPTVGGNWNDHDAITGATTSINSNIAYPVTAVCVNVTAYTSGSIHLGIAKWP